MCSLFSINYQVFKRAVLDCVSVISTSRTYAYVPTGLLLFLVRVTRVKFRNDQTVSGRSRVSGLGSSESSEYSETTRVQYKP